MLKNNKIGLLARAALLTPVLLSACATSAPSAATAPAVQPAPMPEADAKFYAFVKDFRVTALAAGITPDLYDRAMSGISRNARVEDANLTQPEFVKPVWNYLDTAVSPRRVADGQQQLAANGTMLANLQSRYGVPREILVAIWGIESNYGQAMGSFNMFEALATLAYDGPRVDYARKELLAALKMVQSEHLDPKQMTSSWAGAFGKTQLVPSSYLDHAVDGDGDGKRDLWASPADALASTAALLSQAEWHANEPCEYEVTLPKDFHYEDSDSANFKPMDYWRKVGVKTVLGAELPAGPDQGAIYLPAGARGPAFMLLHNFKVVLEIQQRGDLCAGGLLSRRPDRWRQCNRGRMAARRAADDARRTDCLPERSQNARLRSGQHRRRAGPSSARGVAGLSKRTGNSGGRFSDAGYATAHGTGYRGQTLGIGYLRIRCFLGIGCRARIAQMRREVRVNIERGHQRRAEQIGRDGMPFI